MVIVGLCKLQQSATRPDLCTEEDINLWHKVKRISAFCYFQRKEIKQVQRLNLESDSEKKLYETRVRVKEEQRFHCVGKQKYLA